MSRYDRQNFLGSDCDARLRAATIGIVGLGGGGSHVVQQLAHVGIGGFVCVDPDVVEDSNLNRLVGATAADARDDMAKAAVAERMVRGLVAAPRFLGLARKWQDATVELAECDIIVGGVDSYRERSELEAFCRRMMIPYIDMGMDVHDLGDQFAIGGQVILSSPGGPCLWCLGILTDARLEQEAQKYGDAGGKPQVVWPNGVLASLAVGLVMQLLTPWMREPLASAYLEYDGNRQQVATSNRLRAVIGHECRHHGACETGDPLFDIRRQQPVRQLEAEYVSTDPAPVRLSGWRRLLGWLSFRP
jgi:hypothetical protein